MLMHQLTHALQLLRDSDCLSQHSPALFIEAEQRYIYMCVRQRLSSIYVHVHVQYICKRVIWCIVGCIVHVLPYCYY